MAAEEDRMEKQPKQNSERMNRKAIMGIIICNINSYNPWYNIFATPSYAHDEGLICTSKRQKKPTHVCAQPSIRFVPRNHDCNPLLSVQRTPRH